METIRSRTAFPALGFHSVAGLQSCHANAYGCSIFCSYTYVRSFCYTGTNISPNGGTFTFAN